MIRQFRACVSDHVFRPVRAFFAQNCAEIDQRLKPLGEHRAGYARNPPADFAEAARPGQQFADDEQRPASSEDFVRARDGAELPISWHSSPYHDRNAAVVRILDQTFDAS